MFARRLLVSLVSVGALVASGCSDATFTSLNDTFTATKKTATAASNVPLPAAAIAAGLGALELVKSLSDQATSPALYRLAGVEDQQLDIVNDDAQVDMHVVYDSQMGADGSVSSSVSSLEGTVQGYTTAAQGDFAFRPAASKSGKASFTCQLTGSLTANGSAFTVKQFEVAATYPLPTTATELGSCVFQQLDGETVVSELEATLAINAKGRLVVDGNLTTNGKTTSLAEFGQDSMAIVSAN